MFNINILCDKIPKEDNLMLNLAHRQPTFKIFFSCRQPTFQIFFPAGNQIFKYFFAAGNKVITSLPTDNQLFKSFFLEATKFLNLFSHRQPTFLAPEISYFNYEPGSTKVDFPHDGGDDNECNILHFLKEFPVWNPEVQEY